MTLTLTGTTGAGSSVTDHDHDGPARPVPVHRAAGHLHGDRDAHHAGAVTRRRRRARARRRPTATRIPAARRRRRWPRAGSDLTVDFGFYQPVTIGDFVWNDVNGNGVQDDGGEAGHRRRDPDPDRHQRGGRRGDRSHDDAATAATSFTEPPGTYTVAVDATNFHGGRWPATSPTATGKGTTATDSNPSPSGTTRDAGRGRQRPDASTSASTRPVTIGDFVWNDTNGNGVQDGGEPGINGVTLTLTGTNGAGSSVTRRPPRPANGPVPVHRAAGHLHGRR